jgi:hypothetical protein
MVLEASLAHTDVIESDALVAAGKGWDFTIQSCTNLVFGRLGEVDVGGATSCWRSRADAVVDVLRHRVTILTVNEMTQERLAR